MRAALRKANFESVRGSFKFNNNHYPIQNLYIMEVIKDDKGALKAKLRDAPRSRTGRTPITRNAR